MVQDLSVMPMPVGTVHNASGRHSSRVPFGGHIVLSLRTRCADFLDVEIYKNKSVSLAGIQTGSTNALANAKKTFVDYKLTYYLVGVNINDVSILLDPDTGEPVLFHYGE